MLGGPGRMRAEFIELPAFTRAVEESGLSDEWLATLQEDLLLGRGALYRPRKLAGFHKKRVPNPTRGKGKRSGFRVYYMPYADLGVVVLALLTDKDVESNISTEEQKRLQALATELRKEVEAYVRRETRKRTGRRGRGGR